MSQPTPPPPPSSLRRRLLARWPALVAVALLLLVVGAVASRAGRGGPPLLDELPSFSLTDEAGAPFGKAELTGRVWIADFIFTSCADACPRLTEKMRGLQQALAAQRSGVGLLSISVDPERDTPEVLGRYARDVGARPGSWKWLTGRQPEVERAVVRGFHIALSKVPRAPASADAVHEALFDIFHGEKLVLVDRRARIRGYYDADDRATLLAHARQLEATP